MSAVAVIQGGVFSRILQEGESHTFEGTVSYLTIEAATAAGLIKGKIAKAAKAAPEVTADEADEAKSA